MVIYKPSACKLLETRTSRIWIFKLNEKDLTNNSCMRRNFCFFVFSFYGEFPLLYLMWCASVLTQCFIFYYGVYIYEQFLHVLWWWNFFLCSHGWTSSWRFSVRFSFWWTSVRCQDDRAVSSVLYVYSVLWTLEFVASYFTFLPFSCSSSRPYQKQSKFWYYFIPFVILNLDFLKSVQTEHWWARFFHIIWWSLRQLWCHGITRKPS